MQRLKFFDYFLKISSKKQETLDFRWGIGNQFSSILCFIQDLTDDNLIPPKEPPLKSYKFCLSDSLLNRGSGCPSSLKGPVLFPIPFDQEVW